MNSSSHMVQILRIQPRNRNSPIRSHINRITLLQFLNHILLQPRKRKHSNLISNMLPIMRAVQLLKSFSQSFSRSSPPSSASSVPGSVVVVGSRSGVSRVEQASKRPEAAIRSRFREFRIARVKPFKQSITHKTNSVWESTRAARARADSAGSRRPHCERHLAPRNREAREKLLRPPRSWRSLWERCCRGGLESVRLPEVFRPPPFCLGRLDDLGTTVPS